MAYHLPINQWPSAERPRERLLNLGVGSLADAEILALLLGTGRQGKSAVELAQQLLFHCTDIYSLGKYSVTRLAAVPGVGPAKAARLLAACELGRRRERMAIKYRPAIRCPEEAAGIATTYLRDNVRECFLLIFLDTKHHILGEEIISMGGLDQAEVHPREIFRPALERSAGAIILAHNHPSGDPTPSQADLEFTRRLQHASHLLGIRFLDHVIIGDGSFISLAEKGYFKKYPGRRRKG